jgi:hypothetical protein
VRITKGRVSERGYADDQQNKHGRPGPLGSFAKEEEAEHRNGQDHQSEDAQRAFGRFGNDAGSRLEEFFHRTPEDRE